jgi:hypothetical protein
METANSMHAMPVQVKSHIESGTTIVRNKMQHIPVLVKKPGGDIINGGPSAMS